MAAPTVAIRPRAAVGTQRAARRQGERSMDNDELLAALRGDIARINQRIDDTNRRIDGAKSHLGWRIDATNKRIDDAKSHLGWRIDATHKRIDDAKSHLGWRIDHAKWDLRWHIDHAKSDLRWHIDHVKSRLGWRVEATDERVPAVDVFKPQGATLVIGLMVAIALIGTFALQVLAVL